MKLKDLLNGINYKVLQGDLDKEITILSKDVELISATIKLTTNKVVIK